MVDKKLCDVCDKEIQIRENLFKPDGYGVFHTQRRDIELCAACSSAVENFIQDLKDRYKLLEEFKTNPKSIKDQKILGDFDGN